MDSINLTKEELRKLRVVRKDIVWADSDTIYKNDYSFEVKKDYFEILSFFDETKDCVLPEKQLFVSDKPFGYTTTYYKDHESLTRAIKRRDMLFKNKLLTIKSLIETVKNMHSVGIAHGDLHSDNILVCKNKVKIIDFDYSRIKGYTIPNHYKAGLKVDMYMLTILLLNILGEDIQSVDSTIIPLINLLDISEEFRTYLVDAVLERDSVIGVYPDEYMKEINGTLENKVRKLMRTLK